MHNKKSELEVLLNVTKEKAKRIGDANLTKVISHINKYNGVVLFGAGIVGMYLSKSLRKHGIKVLGFVDNDPKKYGTSIEGLPCCSVDIGTDIYKNNLFIISVLRNDWIPLKDQLLKINPDLKVVGYEEFCKQHWQLNRVEDTYVTDVINSKEVILDIYDYLEDNSSKAEYIDQIRYRLEHVDVQFNTSLNLKDQYFPTDLIEFKDEVFYDCGAFDGDSIQEFINHSSTPHEHIYAFEPDKLNLERLKENTKNIKNITCCNCATGCVNGVVNFSSTGKMDAKVNESGSQDVTQVALDSLNRFLPPTLIKMDVEGAELDSLIGARKLITKYSPILAICIYHKQDDIWSIPNYVKSINPQYKCFLRRYAKCAWEEIMYFIPANRLII